MKRYFYTTTDPLNSGFHCDSGWNALTLPDGSHIVVMFESHCTPDPSWTELPHLLDIVALLPANVVTSIGNLVTLPQNPRTFQLVRLLGAINPLFHP